MVRVIRFPDDPRPAVWRSPVLALGNFDGLHRGHMKIVERVRRTSLERGVTPVLLTFEPHPTRILRPDKPSPLILTLAQKVEALRLAGLEGVAVVRFTEEMSRWDPETFVRAVLVEWLGVSEVWVGSNFLFGHDRAGTFQVLRELGSRFGFQADKIDPVCVRDVVVSSSRIRRLMSEGRVDEAAALLGRHPYIDGTVVPGDHRGRTIGFPTANLETQNELLPPYGVYATIVRVGCALLPAVTNIGVRPTFGAGGAPGLEAHLLHWTGDLYGRELRLFFVQRLRDERRFESVDALKAQITEDGRQAERLFQRISV
jgi:riboflavin kinase / FMN adenylyltransferase